MIPPLQDEVVAKKRDALIDILFDMSNVYLEDNSEEIERYASRMSSVYSDEYRQLYSELFPILMAISDGDADSLQPLTTNLVSLYRYVGSSKKWAEKDPELFGHSAESERKLKKAVRKIKNLQLEVVSILAIFAAIVVAFSGGMSILGSALTGMGQVELQDLAFVVILCGIVLFNTVAFLMHVVFWIIRRLHDSEDGESRLIDWKYILGFNVLMVILLAVSVCI